MQVMVWDAELPSIFHLLNNPPSKEEWKVMLNHKIHEKVESLWQADINSMIVESSTKHINSKALKAGNCHHIWSTVRNNFHDSKMAQFKCKLLITDTYVLQANRAAFNQYSVNPTCKLCSKEPETREHFIAKCDSYDSVSETYIKKLLSIPGLPDRQIQQLNILDSLHS